jgi:NAD(P)H dehydrogenase (quinone)
MKHAVILAHPNPDSLCGQIAQAYVRAAGGLGQEAFIRDLYRVGFDPCLKLEETVRPGAGGYSAQPDIIAERSLLAAVDVFAFVYPLWFNAPPAILKGYVDRVYGPGFGYEPDAMGGTASLLDGRRLISFSTSGAPDAWIEETGAVAMLANAFDRHVAAVCGMSVVDHVNFGGIVPGITAESVADTLAKVEATVRNAFDPAATQVA